MTLGDVPVGHVFRLPCGCFCRRMSTRHYEYVTRCVDNPPGSIRAHGPAFKNEEVIYDPFAAMLEVDLT